MDRMYNECAPMVSADGGVDLFEQMYPMEVEVIPKLDEYVYLVNIEGKEIYRVQVYAIGKDFFIPSNADSVSARWKRICFSEFGSLWFYSLEEAQEYIEEYLNENEKMEEGGDDWWMAYTF